MITLKPHVAQMGVPGSSELTEVKFDQDMIYVDGQFVGYWPHHAGAPLLLVRDVPQDLYSALASECALQRGVKTLPMINDGYSKLVSNLKAAGELEDENEEDDDDT